VQAADLQPTIEQMPEVASVTAVSKETAWSSLLNDMGLSNIQGATAQLSGNPLVDQLKVKARNASVVDQLAKKLKQLQGVDEVQYVNEVVQRINQLNHGLNWLSLAVILLLTSTAIAVITTTIRLIVMARRREIEVMQLVGATTTWIYLPFILQGLVLGVVGAVVAWGLIVSVQQFVSSLLSQQSQFIQFLSGTIQLTTQQNLLLPLALLGLGCSVGLLGSLFAVRRFAIR
jgi:cell division transport system permease protein